MEGLERWRDHGIYPGNFLTAVLENDLIGSLGRADEENLANLPAYGAYLYNEMPIGSHGSKEIMRAWSEARIKDRR